MQSIQTFEGYYKEGCFHIYDHLVKVPVNGRILITILDEHPANKRDTWDAFDKMVDEIEDKLKLEDFPRSDLVRQSVDFN